MDEREAAGYRPPHIMPPSDKPSAPPAARLVSARLKLTVGDLAIAATISVPAEPAPAEAVLPTLQNLVNTVVDAAEAREVAAGREISCRKGCGACCRQLVPISQTEARAIRALVEAQPPERREVLRQRFAGAAARLAEAELTEALLDPARRIDKTDWELGREYFALGIACPFLEDESCSIHRDRPLVCREYLVTSPAIFCGDIEHAEIRPVGVPKLSVAARGLENQPASPDSTAQWLPLALALEAPHSGDDHKRVMPGPDWIKRFFDAMQAAGKARDV